MSWGPFVHLLSYDEEKQLKPSYNDPELFSDPPLANHLAGNCYLCGGLHYRKDCPFDKFLALLEEARDKSENMELRFILGNPNLPEMDSREEDPRRRRDYVPQIQLNQKHCTRLPENTMEPIQYANGPKVPPKSRGTQLEPQDWPSEIIEEPCRDYKVLVGGVTKLHGKTKQPRKVGGPDSSKKGATPTKGAGSAGRPSSLRLTRGLMGSGAFSSGGLGGAGSGGMGGGGGNGPPSDHGDSDHSSEDDDHEYDSTSTSEDEQLYRIFRNRHLLTAGVGGSGDPDPNIPWVFRG